MSIQGFQLYRKLKDIDHKLTICFLTAANLAYYREKDSDIIAELGTNCFVSKPVNNEDLVRRLKSILSKKADLM